MKKIAIFGFGNHVKKNIIPAIARSDKLEISFIIRRNIDDSFLNEYKSIKFISLKESFKKINHKNTNLIYISNPTSEHYKCAKDAILNKFDVLCEKPLTDSFKKTKNLIDLAKSNSVFIKEVCIYKSHKQYEYLKNSIIPFLDEINFVESAFCIPALPENDFRYQKSLGGGATLDLGYYPISIILSLFGNPNSIESEVNYDKNLDIDIGGSAKLNFERFSASTIWQIGGSYKNFIKIYCDKKTYKFDRIFSKPHDFVSSYIISEKDNNKEIVIGADDHFVNIFESDIKKTNNNHELLNSKYLENILIKGKCS